MTSEKTESVIQSPESKQTAGGASLKVEVTSEVTSTTKPVDGTLKPNVEKTTKNEKSKSEEKTKYGLTSSQYKLLKKFKEELPEILEDTEYDELFGYQLTSTGEYYNEEMSDFLLIKILKSVNYNLDPAKESLEKILEWRKDFDPLFAAFNEDHGLKYDPSGIITLNPEGAPNLRVITWNFYGKVKNTSVYFSDPAKFLRWRVGLMEKAMQLLDFKDPDNDYMVQIHDYAGVSMFKMDANAKKASRSVIDVFSNYYPELLSKKWFVNVPSIMAWLYAVFKSFVPEVTRKKFNMLKSGKELEGYISKGSKNFPKVYGGIFDGSIEALKYEFKREQMTPYTSYLLEHKLTDEVD